MTANMLNSTVNRTVTSKYYETASMLGTCRRVVVHTSRTIRTTVPAPSKWTVHLDGPATRNYNWL